MPFPALSWVGIHNNIVGVSSKGQVNDVIPTAYSTMITVETLNHRPWDHEFLSAL